MRKVLKFLHTVSSAGILGALATYMLVLSLAPQATVQDYANVRQTIAALANYILMPSLALSLVTGLLAMAVHRPFQELRWVWIKALLGISMFEGTLAIIQAKAGSAAKLSAQIAAGGGDPKMLATAISSEWTTLYAITAISLANYVLAVWRPSLTTKTARPVSSTPAAPRDVASLSQAE
jgi:hypothetical protein